MDFSNIINVLNMILYIFVGIAGAIMGAVITVKGMQSKLEHLGAEFTELSDETKDLKKTQQHFAENYVKNTQMREYINLILVPIQKEISVINTSHAEHKTMLNTIIGMLGRIEEKKTL